MPSGLPTPELPDGSLIRDHYPQIAIAAIGVLLIGFSQTAGDARAFAARHRYRIDVNQESVAQGLANAGAGVLQGMPVTTSLSASSLNESSGARTQLSSLVTGGLVIATLLVLAPLFSDLPKAVLGAVIIDAVVFGMIDVTELRRLYRVTRFDFWVAVAAIIGVLSVGVLAGVVIGVVLSLGWLIYVATRPPMPLLGREPGTHFFRDLDENPGDRRFLASPFSAWTAASSSPRPRRSRTGSASSPTRAAAPSYSTFEGVDFVDSQGAAKLAEIHELMQSDGVTLRLARLKPQVRVCARGRRDRRSDRPRPHPWRCVRCSRSAAGPATGVDREGDVSLHLHEPGGSKPPPVVRPIDVCGVDRHLGWESRVRPARGLGGGAGSPTAGERHESPPKLGPAVVRAELVCGPLRPVARVFRPLLAWVTTPRVSAPGRARVRELQEGSDHHQEREAPAPAARPKVSRRT